MWALLLGLIIQAQAATSKSEYLRMAEQAHARFDYAQAIVAYEKASSSDRGDRLKLAEMYFWRAVELPDGEQEQWLERSESTLEALIAEPRAQPKASDDAKFESLIHAELGRTLGQLALHRGGKGKIKLGNRIRAEADLAVTLDPANALAHAVLGKWNFELSSLSGLERTLGSVLFGKIPEGSFEAAVMEFRKAVGLDPKEPYFRLMLAQALLKVGDKAEARTQLDALLKLAPREASDRQYASEARELLKKLAP